MNVQLCDNVLTYTFCNVCDIMYVFLISLTQY